MSKVGPLTARAKAKIKCKGNTVFAKHAGTTKLADYPFPLSKAMRISAEDQVIGTPALGEINEPTKETRTKNRLQLES